MEAPIPLDKDLYPFPEKNAFRAFGNLAGETRDEAVLRRLNDLRRRNPHLFYELVKRGGGQIETPVSVRSDHESFFAQPRPTSYIWPDLPVSDSASFISTDFPAASPRLGPFQAQASDTPIAVNPSRPADSALLASIPNLRRMVTGTSERWVDVPSVMAKNAEEFVKPKNLPAAFTAPEIEELTPIFQGMEKLNRDAFAITGYNPDNPPSANTLSLEQVHRLSPLQQEQYFAATDRRHKMIEAAKRQHDRLLNLGEQALVNKYLGEERKKQSDAESVSTAFEQAALEKEKTDEAKKAADKALAEWQSEVNRHASNKRMSQDPKSKLVKPGPAATFTEPGQKDNSYIPWYKARVEELNTALPVIQARVAETAKAQAEANAAFKKAETLAASRRQSTVRKTPANRPIASTPILSPDGSRVMVVNPQGITGWIPKANLPVAIGQRGFKLAQ